MARGNYAWLTWRVREGWKAAGDGYNRLLCRLFGHAWRPSRRYQGYQTCSRCRARQRDRKRAEASS
jgi:hypothetical protein